MSNVNTIARSPGALGTSRVSFFAQSTPRLIVAERVSTLSPGDRRGRWLSTLAHDQEQAA